MRRTHPVRLVVEDDLRAEPADRLLPAPPRDPALHLGPALDDRRRSSSRSSTGSRRSSPGGRPTALHGFLSRYVRYTVHLNAYLYARREPVSRGSSATRASYAVDVQLPGPGAAAALEDGAAARPRDPGADPLRRARRRPAGRRSTRSAAAAAPRADVGGGGGALVGVLRVPRLVRLARAGRMPRGLRDAGAYGSATARRRSRTCCSSPTATRTRIRRRCSPASSGRPRIRCGSSATRTTCAARALTVFFRLPLAIPHLVWLVLWGDRSRCSLGIVNWFATLFTRHAAARASTASLSATSATSSTSTRSSTSPRTRSPASRARRGAIRSTSTLPPEPAAAEPLEDGLPDRPRDPRAARRTSPSAAALVVAAFFTWFVALVTRRGAVGPAQPLGLRAALRRADERVLVPR